MVIKAGDLVDSAAQFWSSGLSLASLVNHVNDGFENYDIVDCVDKDFRGQYTYFDSYRPL